MPLKLNSTSGGSVTLQEPTTASNRTLTLPDATGTVIYSDASGNVGIGTSSPSSKLHVAGGSGSTIRNTASAGSSWFVGSNVDSYILHNESNTPMVFTTNGSERARIDSSGNLLIARTDVVNQGRISVNMLGGTNVGLSVVNTNGSNTGNFCNFARSDTTVIGAIQQNGASAVTYSTSSDYRLKENIAPMTGALAKVAQLKPCTYTWKIDGSTGEGFIAHELQAVVPDCVTGEKDAVDSEGNIKPQGIDTSFLVATLTAAIQEQQAMIEELKAKVAALEAK
jgi:hypothetical protein